MNCELNLRAGETSTPVDEVNSMFFNREVFKEDVLFGSEFRDSFKTSGQLWIGNVGIVKGNELTDVFSHLYQVYT